MADFEDLAARARDAARRSYSPYSGVRVGCALETDEGVVFDGTNIENASFSVTMCAERVALFKAVSEGARGVKRVFIWSDTGLLLPPCGACLQVLSEWMADGAEVTLLREDGEARTYAFRELLPVDLSGLRNHLK
ncbi:MAG: cytidine deaminase [Candidatus Eisenbacteria bacterium]|nr:cytidine deaminase [Candidatus Eisenbacteria bacterium]